MCVPCCCCQLPFAFAIAMFVLGNDGLTVILRHVYKGGGGGTISMYLYLSQLPHVPVTLGKYL